MRISAYTFHGGPCVGSKRVYSSAVFSWDCPSCNVKVNESFDQSPLVYVIHAHRFYCHDCGYESDFDMYSIDGTQDCSVDISPSKENNLKVFCRVTELVEITD